MADKVNPNLNESVRAGGFYRVEALSGKEEDATYVDSEGQRVPDEDVAKFKAQNEEKSKHAEEVSRAMPSGSALSPAAPLQAPTNQQTVVDPNRSDSFAATADLPDTAGGTRGSI
jgi:hypothetical protein